MPADPTFELLKAMRALLLESNDVMALVPANCVIDTTKRPDLFPRINIAMGQTEFGRFFCTSYADLHVWVREEGAEMAMSIASAVTDAVSIDAQIDGSLRLENFVVHDLSVERTRPLPDPDGMISHVVVSIAAIVQAN